MRWKYFNQPIEDMDDGAIISGRWRVVVMGAQREGPRDRPGRDGGAASGVMMGGQASVTQDTLGLNRPKNARQTDPCVTGRTCPGACGFRSLTGP